ncbi:MAG TPA: PIN domain-containing protein [Polyangiaceae bacterium]
MILADTGFWLALANPKDRDHVIAVGALEEIREPLTTTWPVLTETCHLLLSRHGAGAARKLLESGKNGAFEVFQLEAAHLGRISELMKRYENLPMDLADASLVVAAEVLGSGRILSTDRRDFRAYRWKDRKPFKNLIALSD